MKEVMIMDQFIKKLENGSIGKKFGVKIINYMYHSKIKKQ